MTIRHPLVRPAALTSSQCNLLAMEVVGYGSPKIGLSASDLAVAMVQDNKLLLPVLLYLNSKRQTHDLLGYDCAGNGTKVAPRALSIAEV